MGSCDLVLRSDYENINIAPIKCELSVCDLQESRMRGMMANMVLVQYLFCVLFRKGRTDAKYSD